MACKQQVTLCCILICPSGIRPFEAAVSSLIPLTMLVTKSLGRINQNWQQWWMHPLNMSNFKH